MDLSRITDDIYVGSQPDATQAEALRGLNIGLVINMRAEQRPHPAFGTPPLSSLWLRTYDFFLTPIRMSTLEQGARAALAVIGQGRRVLVHCQRGRHRSVAMAAAILIAQGYTAGDAMRLLSQKRPVADPQIWYIRRQIEKFERHWRARAKTMTTPQTPLTPNMPAGGSASAGPTLSASAQRVQEALAALGFTLAVVELPQSTRSATEAATAVGCSVGQIVKSLIFRGGQSGRAILVLASGSNRVGEAEVAALLGEPLSKPDADFVRAHTGFVIGGVPPVGHLEAMPTFIDEDLLAYDSLWAAAGTPNAVFKLTPTELVGMSKGTVAQIKKPSTLPERKP
jgi:prolyl-tRNA editing enzyme YbaK/EbsC (Cys-tRNA(Pro) deacylase)/rhodanese-related sulfurtransferase